MRTESFEEREFTITTDEVVYAARALLKGTLSESALGDEVMYALRGFRAGLMDRRNFLKAVSQGYRTAGVTFRFDNHGNLRRA